MAPPPGKARVDGVENFATDPRLPPILDFNARKIFDWKKPLWQHMRDKFGLSLTGDFKTDWALIANHLRRYYCGSWIPSEKAVLEKIISNKGYSIDRINEGWRSITCEEFRLVPHLSLTNAELAKFTGQNLRIDLPVSWPIFFNWVFRRV